MLLQGAVRVMVPEPVAEHPNIWSCQNDGKEIGTTVFDPAKKIKVYI